MCFVYADAGRYLRELVPISLTCRRLRDATASKLFQTIHVRVTTRYVDRRTFNILLNLDLFIIRLAIASTLASDGDLEILFLWRARWCRWRRRCGRTCTLDAVIDMSVMCDDFLNDWRSVDRLRRRRRSWFTRRLRDWTRGTLFTSDDNLFLLDRISRWRRR